MSVDANAVATAAVTIFTIATVATATTTQSTNPIAKQQELKSTSKFNKTKHFKNKITEFSFLSLCLRWQKVSSVANFRRKDGTTCKDA